MNQMLKQEGPPELRLEAVEDNTSSSTPEPIVNLGIAMLMAVKGDNK